MTVFDWFYFLTPAALLICLVNVLVGAALKPEHRTITLRFLSTIGYIGCAAGWLIMRIGISLHPMTLIMKIATIGWLILVPALLLVTGCCIKRLRKEKSCYTDWAVQITKIILTITHYIFLIIYKLFQTAFLLVCYLLATTKPSSYEEMEEEQRRRKPDPFISHRVNDPNADGYSHE
ncbi:MAG TPA: hypothetical protein VHZ76_09475 [Gammaproteobacteria bacterium]|jgi:hypothetical protein|nr:hypothetical protein [Gammaproteobacteria bacterium]